MRWRVAGPLLCLSAVIACKEQPRSKPSGPAATSQPAAKAKSKTPSPSQPLRGAKSDALLGAERGFDHVGVVVKDLTAAAANYQALGFGNPQPGRLPNGIQNINFYFGDSTYLELLTHYDAVKAKGVASFVARHGDGAMFFVLAVSSYGQTSAFLRRQGHPVGRPFPGRIKSKGFSGQRTMWHTFFFAPPKPLPGDPFFFITYRRSLRRFLLDKLADPKIRAKSFSHPNTALGLKAAYLVAANLDQTRSTYARIGLPAKAAAPLATFGAQASTIDAGQGHLALLSAKGGKVAAFRKRRGDGAIFALTIEVAELDKARALIAKHLGQAPTVSAGLFGQSFFVPPDKAHGVWLEFVQANKTP